MAADARCICRSPCEIERLRLAWGCDLKSLTSFVELFLLFPRSFHAKTMLRKLRYSSTTTVQHIYKQTQTHATTSTTSAAQNQIDHTQTNSRQTTNNKTLKKLRRCHPNAQITRQTSNARVGGVNLSGSDVGLGVGEEWGFFQKPLALIYSPPRQNDVRWPQYRSTTAVYISHNATTTQRLPQNAAQN